MKIRIILFLMCLLTGLTSFAQKTNFSGTWTLKDQQSISGNLYSNGLPGKIKVTQTENNIIIETTTAGANGDVVRADTIINDKPLEALTASKRKRVSTIKWNGDKSFTKVMNIYSAADNTKLEYTDTDIWTIQDGNFILQRKSENFTNGEVWESKGIYEKQ